MARKHPYALGIRWALLVGGVLFALAAALPAQAQSTAAQRTVNNGDQAFDRNQFQEAIASYQKALDYDDLPRDTRYEVMERLADAYRLSNQFDKAEQWYKQLLRRQRNNPTAVLNYGKALKNIARFDEAKKQFRDYLELKPNSDQGKMLLRSCDSAQYWLYNPIDVDVREVVSVNTAAREFSPTVYQNGIMFTSDREGTTQKFIRLDGGADVNRLDLFYAPFSSEENTFKTPYVIEGLNYHGHDAAPTLSRDGKEIFFTRTVATKAKATVERREYAPRRRRERASEEEQDQEARGQTIVINNLQIFYSQLQEDGSWSKPTNELSMNNVNYSVGHPTLSPDGKMLVYMSDRKGGRGGTDLYFSMRKEDSTWTPPKTMGPVINTFGFELFPYFDEKGRLYYSTDGKAGLGRLDMFRTQYDSSKGSWQEPVNMRPPINSIFDDFGLSKIPGATVDRGYFSSQRLNGTGNDDIYTYIYNDVSLILDGNQLVLEDLGFFNGFSYQLFEKQSQTEIPGRKEDQKIVFDLLDEQEYLLAIRKDGFFFDEIQLRYEGKANGRLKRMVVDPGQQPLSFTGYYKRYRLTVNDSGGVAYNRDSFEVLTNELIGLMQGKDLLDRDTTDARGAFFFRIDTSGTYVITTDSQDVRKEIVEPEPSDSEEKLFAGDSSRILYGQVTHSGQAPPEVRSGSVRVLQEGSILGRSDISDSGGYRVRLPLEIGDGSLRYEVSAYAFRDTSFSYLWSDLQQTALEKNIALYPRRSIEISGTVLPRENPDQTSIDLFVDGTLRHQTQPDAQGRYRLNAYARESYEIVVNKKGFLAEERKLGPSQTDLENVDFTLTEKASENRIVKLENIYWDFDSYRLRASAEPTLNKLVRFLEANPNKTIEIRSHTDRRGSASYNQYLSQRRAQTVVNYLRDQGIADKRLVPAGYGESKPLVENATTDAEFQKNRRTEFRIIDLDGFVNTARNRFEKRLQRTSEESYYMVQVGVFSKPLPGDHPYFRGLDDLSIQQKDGYYRYYYGYTIERPEARQFLQQARYRGLSESFIAVFKDGERVKIL